MKKGFILLIVFVTLLSCSAFRNQVFAQTPTTACQTPTAPTNVSIAYPSCVGTQCSFAQATCTWLASTNASTYTVKITEVDTGTVVKNESVASSVLTYTFTVTANKTYKCEITGVNSCGTAGATGSYSLLCQVDAPTAAPTTPPVVPTVAPTRAPLPPTGSETFVIAGVIAVLFVLTGGLLLVF